MSINWPFSQPPEGGGLSPFSWFLRFSSPNQGHGRESFKCTPKIEISPNLLNFTFSLSLVSIPAGFKSTATTCRPQVFLRNLHPRQTPKAALVLGGPASQLQADLQNLGRNSRGTVCTPFFPASVGIPAFQGP